jgi:hypothetical protein
MHAIHRERDGSYFSDAIHGVMRLTWRWPDNRAADVYIAARHPRPPVLVRFVPPFLVPSLLLAGTRRRMSLTSPLQYHKLCNHLPGLVAFLCDRVLLTPLQQVARRRVASPHRIVARGSPERPTLA